MKRRLRLFAPVLVVILSLPLGWSTAGAETLVPGCGNLDNGFGPYDYRNPVLRRDRLPVVEDFHFTPEVRALIAGETGSIVADLDYTLRAFPNHPAALDAMARFGMRGGRIATPIGSVECYFERAMAFAQDDTTVRVLYGNYLFKQKQTDKAKEQYEVALRLAPESAEIAYNAGLFFLSVGDLGRARKLAELAYSQGYPLSGLKTSLERATANQSVESPKPAQQPASK